MPKRTGQRDGLIAIGKRRGKLAYRARITWRDPETGATELDTTRIILADSKHEAMAARESLRDQLIGIRQGRRSHVITMHDLLDEWFATVETPSTRISWGSHKRKIDTAMGQRRIGDLTSEDLQRFLDGIKLTAGTVNSVRDVLIKAYRHAHRRHYLGSAAVAEGTHRRSKRRNRSEALAAMEGGAAATRRSLEPEQIGAFLRAVRAYQGGEYAALILTQLALGCRFGEVSAIKVSDVDWDTGEVVIRRSQTRGELGPPKAGYARAAMLGDAGLELLKDHRQKMLTQQRPGAGEGWLFVRRFRPNRARHSAHYSISTVGGVVKQCLGQCGIVLPVRTHIARHTLNNLARGQVSDVVLRAVVGHRSEEVARRYTAAERSELARLAGVMEGVIHGDTAGDTAQPKGTGINSENT